MTLITRIFLALVLLLVQPSYASSSVVTLGSFSNQRQSTSDDPHIEGYSLTLYREGEIVFGRFCWATGIEIPCAPIQKAVIGRAGKLTFETKLSILLQNATSHLLLYSVFRACVAIILPLVFRLQLLLFSFLGSKL